MSTWEGIRMMLVTFGPVGSCLFALYLHGRHLARQDAKKAEARRAARVRVRARAVAAEVTPLPVAPPPPPVLNAWERL